MIDKQRPPLEYAPPLPLYRRRRIQQRAVATVLLIAVALLAVTWRSTWHGLRYVYLRRQLAHIQLPPNKVIFEADPNRAQALLSADPNYHREIGGDRGPYAKCASWMPRQLIDLSGLVAPSGGANFRAHAPAVFISERTTPSGKRVLLVLRFGGYVVEGDGPVCYQFWYDVYTQYFERDGAVVTREIMIPEHARFDRLLAGQADPKDPTHLSFTYIANGQQGIIEAWLDDDTAYMEPPYMKLRMRPRSGPASTQQSSTHP